MDELHYVNKLGFACNIQDGEQGIPRYNFRLLPGRWCWCKGGITGSFKAGA